MGIELVTERHRGRISGELSCYDRVLMFGTLPKICYAEGMTSYMYERKMRIFDYPKFAEPFLNQLRENAETLAKENGIEIAFVRKRNVRKEDLVKTAIAKRGEHPELVCILSAMEPCSSYQPWPNKSTLASEHSTKEKNRLHADRQHVCENRDWSQAQQIADGLEIKQLHQPRNGSLITARPKNFFWYKPVQGKYLSPNG